MFLLETPGTYTVVEGPDGAGATTLISYLAGIHDLFGWPYVRVKEPNEMFESGRKIRRILRGEEVVENEIEKQMLFVENRKEHMREIVLPSLRNGIHVLSDRSFISTLAFGVGQGADLRPLVLANNQFPWPDLVFILLTSVRVTQRRIENRGERELHDDPEIQRRVLSTYSTLVRELVELGIPRPPVVLEGNLSREEAAIKAVTHILRLHKKLRQTGRIKAA